MEEYSLEYGLVDVCDVCNKEKPFPTEWITGNNNDISPEFANYALPLMRGVPEHVFEDGVPKYLYKSNRIVNISPLTQRGFFDAK